jgi:hypothetical protein
VTSTPQWWKFSQKVLDLKRPIREADPVPSELLRQIDRLLKGRDQVLEGRLQKRGGGGHGEYASYDWDGWGCPLMYMGSD